MTSAPSASATATPASVLPDAVGPTSARSASPGITRRTRPNGASDGGDRHPRVEPRADEMMRVRRDHAHVEERSRPERLVDVHHLVGARPAPRAALAADALDQDLMDPADLVPHALERDRLLQRDQPVEPLLDDLLRQLVRQLRGASTGTPRVLERVRLVELRACDDVERRAEVLLRLAGEPDDDVGADRDARDRLADPV